MTNQIRPHNTKLQEVGSLFGRALGGDDKTTDADGRADARRSTTGDVPTQARTLRTGPELRVGRRIGSAALVADGLHARTDGFTSLAVVVGAIGVMLGFPLADPIIGLVITAAIFAVLRRAATCVFRRLMDAVGPRLIDQAEGVLSATPGVRSVDRVRMR